MNTEANSTSLTKGPNRSGWRGVRWLKWPLRALCALSVVVGLCVLLSAGWIWNTNRRGEAALQEILAELDRRNLPTDTYYLKKQFDASGEGENGARFYKAAFAALGTNEAYDDLPHVGLAAEPELAAPMDKGLAAKIRTFLEKQQTFLGLLSTARKHPRCFYDFDLHAHQFDALAVLGKIMNAGRVLRIKALDGQASGRPEAALDACEAMADIDLSLRNDPQAMVMLIRISNTFHLYESIRDTLSRTTLDAADLKRLRAKLLLALRAVGISEMLKAEMAFAAVQAKDPHLHGAAEIYRVGQYEDMFRRWTISERQEETSSQKGKPEGNAEVVPFETNDSDNWPTSGARPDLAWASICPGVSRLASVWSIKGMLELYDELQQRRTEQTTDTDVALELWRTGSAPLFASVNSWSPYFSELAQRQARLVVAATALSAEIHRIENGKWPESLGELGGEALLDPFSGKPLKYKQADGDCIIYSVGMNQQDDGGEEDGNYRADDHKDDIAFRLFAVEERNVKPKASP